MAAQDQASGMQQEACLQASQAWFSPQLYALSKMQPPSALSQDLVLPQLLGQ
jgi:hypothetical protein